MKSPRRNMNRLKEIIKRVTVIKSSGNDIKDVSSETFKSDLPKIVPHQKIRFNLEHRFLKIDHIKFWAILQPRVLM